jgi:hypothetical protein
VVAVVKAPPVLVQLVLLEVMAVTVLRLVLQDRLSPMLVVAEVEVTPAGSEVQAVAVTLVLDMISSLATQEQLTVAAGVALDRLLVSPQAGKVVPEW